MTNSANGIQREIKVKGQKLGTVTSFKYLGPVVSDDGSKPEILSRIEQATVALTKLKPISRVNSISLGRHIPSQWLLLLSFCCLPSLVNSYIGMSGRSVNRSTLFLGWLRPPKRITSIKSTYFRH